MMGIANLENGDIRPFQTTQLLLISLILLRRGKVPFEIGNCNISKLASETLDELSTVHGQRFNFHTDINIQGQFSCSE